MGFTVAVVPTGNALNLQWNNMSGAAPEDSDLVGYKVYRSTSSGFAPGPTPRNWARRDPNEQRAPRGPPSALFPVRRGATVRIRAFVNRQHLTPPTPGPLSFRLADRCTSICE